MEATMLMMMLAVWPTKENSLGMAALTALLKSSLRKKRSISVLFSSSHWEMVADRSLVCVVWYTHRVRISPNFWNCYSIGGMIR